MLKRRFSIPAAVIGVAVDFVGIIISLKLSGLLRLHWEPSMPGMWSLMFFAAPYVVTETALEHFTYFSLNGLIGVPISCAVWGCAVGFIWPLLFERGTQRIYPWDGANSGSIRSRPADSNRS